MSITISDMCLMMRVVVMINDTGQVACLSPSQTCFMMGVDVMTNGGLFDFGFVVEFLFVLFLWCLFFYTLVPVSGGYSRVLWLDVAAVCISNRLWRSCGSSHLLRHGIKELRERTRLMMTWM